jgi:RHS repeat-associated protein
MKTADSTETRYIYSGWQRIADYHGPSSSATVENYYIYGPGLDEPLIQVNGTTKAVTAFFHQDRMGSVIGLSDFIGAIVNKNSFGPFGETGTLSGTSFGFTGQRFDPETGLYYYKNRYYLPTIGRFLQPDPIGYAGGDLNLYAYVNNSPQVSTDPLGLWPSTPRPTGPGLPAPSASPSPPAASQQGGSNTSTKNFWTRRAIADTSRSRRNLLIRLAATGFQSQKREADRTVAHKIRHRHGLPKGGIIVFIGRRSGPLFKKLTAYLNCLK